MSASLPKMMNAVVLDRYDDELTGIRVEERPVPKPRAGEVLVKMLASPINPSDLLFCQGRYGFTRPLPTVPGFEASGHVVAAGSGLIPRLWMGRRVTCAVQQEGDGTWADYVCAPALQTLPISKQLSDEQGSMLLVNPLTAYALIGMAKQRRVKTVVQTAAGSALGGMIWRWGQKQGVAVINVVRRPDQAAELRQAGREYVLCSSDPDYEAQLTEISTRMKATIALDAVGGETTRQLVRAMPRHTHIYLYGLLSNAPAQGDLVPMVFGHKSVEGFWLSDWIYRVGLIRMFRAFNQVQGMAGSEMKSEVRARYGVGQAVQALADYRAQMSGGKVLFVGKKEG